MRSGIRKSTSAVLAMRRRQLAYKILPYFLRELMDKYLRVTSSGMHRIPKDGPAIIIANHSGFMGFDALMIRHQILKKRKRHAQIVAHKLWFLHPRIAVRAKNLGMVPATLSNAEAILKRGKLLLLFPEGEEGNFKPTSKRYHLRRFRRGYIRLALTTGAPIIPISVIGAEETHITLSQIRWAKQLLGIIIPIPLNVLPLPARWHIHVGKAIRLKSNPEKARNLPEVTRLSKHYRGILQKQINQDLRKREHVFL